MVSDKVKQDPSDWHSFHSFRWHVQNLTIPCRSQELLPFLSVTYFFLPLPSQPTFFHPLSPHLAIYFLVCLSILFFPDSYTGCHRRKGPNFGRVFLMLNYTDITQNTYIQSWTVTEIMAREVWNFDSCYTLTDYQIHIKTGRNMWFL